jgi:DNA polymerase zeta
VIGIDYRVGSQSPEATEHFFLPPSSESEEEIDTSESAVKFPHTRDIDRFEVGERTEAVTKTWLDNGEQRPMKRLRIAIGQNNPDLAQRHDLFHRTGTQSPRAFSIQAKKEIKNAFVYAVPPPPASELLSTLEFRGLPSKIYQDPHYSKAEDVPERPWEFAGLVYRLKNGDGLSILEEWKPSSIAEPLEKNAKPEDINVFEDRFDRTGVGGWEYASAPPSMREVCRWLRSMKRAREKPQAQSQVSGGDNSP